MNQQKDRAVRLVCENLTSAVAAWQAWYTELIETFRAEMCYIWGAGEVGRAAAHIVARAGGRCAFVDRDADKWGTHIGDALCISPEELRAVPDPLVLIAVGLHGKAVAAQLGEMGIRRVIDMEHISMSAMYEDLCDADPETVAERAGACFDLLADDASRDVLLTRLRGFFEFIPGFGKYRYYDDIYRGDQYFQDDIIRFNEESVLVDCGAYTGDTLADFLRRGYPFRKYIAYELSRRNYEILAENMRVHGGGTGELLAYNCGVGARHERIFYSDVVSASAITQEGTPGEIVRMSDHLKDEYVTFIKMDIEGAERDALTGAADLIRRCRPDLAICVYHSVSDLWEIPLMIHEIEPSYRLYMRHHTPLIYETVCYAVK